RLIVGGDTIFSKIIKKEIPADIVFESEEILAFKDINPIAPIHILIIPKKEFKSLAEVSDGEALLLGKCLIVAKNIAKELGVADSGYRVVTNIGENASQSVFHLHFHLIAGREFKWPPG
ncbi:UNVERIFIED_CONTAM: hypothetical protein GTU68_028887, partial [Idotea baltica]|nr:hypothetical protein [Idotea baltica]